MNFLKTKGFLLKCTRFSWEQNAPQIVNLALPSNHLLSICHGSMDPLSFQEKKLFLQKHGLKKTLNAELAKIVRTERLMIEENL